MCDNSGYAGTQGGSSIQQPRQMDTGGSMLPPMRYGPEGMQAPQFNAPGMDGRTMFSSLPPSRLDINGNPMQSYEDFQRYGNQPGYGAQGGINPPRMMDGPGSAFMGGGLPYGPPGMQAPQINAPGMGGTTMFSSLPQQQDYPPLPQGFQPSTQQYPGQQLGPGGYPMYMWQGN